MNYLWDWGLISLGYGLYSRIDYRVEWNGAKWIWNILITTNHIWIGGFHILVGIIGGSLGYGLSILLRLELSCSGYVSMSWLQYNSIITFHGIYMTLSMIMPILIGVVDIIIEGNLMLDNKSLIDNPFDNSKLIWLRYFS